MVNKLPDLHSPSFTLNKKDNLPTQIIALRKQLKEWHVRASVNYDRTDNLYHYKCADEQNWVRLTKKLGAANLLKRQKTQMGLFEQTLLAFALIFGITTIIAVAMVINLFVAFYTIFNIENYFEIFHNLLKITCMTYALTLGYLVTKHFMKGKITYDK